jgi:hypothetical protein
LILFDTFIQLAKGLDVAIIVWVLIEVKLTYFLEDSLNLLLSWLSFLVLKKDLLLKEIMYVIAFVVSPRASLRINLEHAFDNVADHSYIVATAGSDALMRPL